MPAKGAEKSLLHATASSSTIGAEHGGARSYGLQQSVLSSVETLAQSIAGMAPSAAPAMTIAVVFATAGNAGWLVYLIATVCMILTALNINVFASRSSTPGSLYSYATDAGGKYLGFLTGWSVLLAYTLCLTVCPLQFAIFANESLKQIGLWQLPTWMLALSCIILAAVVAYKNIQLSAKMMLWLELVSIAVITILCAVILVHQQFRPDMAQIQLSGINAEGLRLGLIMAIFAFVGFESATTLGSEATTPLKNIPRALINSTIFSGLFFVFSTYAIVYGFAVSGQPLDKCTTPLMALANNLGMPLLGHLTNICAAISFFAATLAALNAGARVLMTMSHDGHFPKMFSKTHNCNFTPHYAVITISTVGAILAGVFFLSQCSLLDVVGWLGSLATFGFLVAYGTVSVAAPIYLKRHNELTVPAVAISLITTIILATVFFGTMFPAPEGVYRWLPYLFLAYLIAGALIVRLRKNLDQSM